jgi:hypothetical protein
MRRNRTTLPAWRAEGTEALSDMSGVYHTRYLPLTVGIPWHRRATWLRPTAASRRGPTRETRCRRSRGGTGRSTRAGRKHHNEPDGRRQRKERRSADRGHPERRTNEDRAESSDDVGGESLSKSS